MVGFNEAVQETPCLRIVGRGQRHLTLVVPGDVLDSAPKRTATECVDALDAVRVDHELAGCGPGLWEKVERSITAEIGREA